MHAFRLRGENKDACDLVYTLTHFGDGTASPDHVGPMRAARFTPTRPTARNDRASSPRSPVARVTPAGLDPATAVPILGASRSVPCPGSGSAS